MTGSFDPGLYDTPEEAVEAILEQSVEGNVINVCRGNWQTCPDGEVCAMCARVTVVEGMTARDVFAQAKAYHA